jgi:hypothetical protein
MNNIIIEKVWNDSDIINNELFEIKLTCINEYISINEKIYMDNNIAKNISKKLENYIKTNKETYYEMNMKKGYTSGFAIKIFPCDVTGHILIEMKMEITDNSEKLHYATFYIKTEIGTLEIFNKKLENIIKLEIGEKIKLYNN